MYEIIEKNQYGVFVDQLSNPSVLACTPCKYSKTKSLNEEPCLSCNCDGYYLPDSESEKLESENQLMNTTIDDLYIESKCYFEVKKKLDDTQKELIDLRVELRVEKEKCKALIKYLEKNIERCKNTEHHYKMVAKKRSSDVNWAMGQAYQNVLEFIKNQK